MNDTKPDPLEGQEISMLNTLLAKAWPLAREGDAKAADRVIKILQLKAKRGDPTPYRKDGTWD